MGSAGWYNGVRAEARAIVALIGGPYATLEDAKAAKRADEDYVFEHARGGERLSHWGTWYSVELATPHATLRDAIAGRAAHPDVVAEPSK